DVPTGISASAGNGTATISWSAANGATSYDVYETPASGSTVKIGSATAPTTSLTVAGLTNGTVYAFNVVAVNSAGSSAPSATVTVTPQSPPSGSG
ncbi:fibronectin type III domain-containing protein, partial [Acinetobacter baumannii]